MKKFLLPLFLFSLTAIIPLRASAVPLAIPVFINEIHYDNTGTDTGEAIEIAGPAGTDLTGWSIVLYNGATGLTYDSDALTGTIPDLCDGYGTITLNYPADGIQNGAPDGIALVNSSTVIQFLSYEGGFTAANGIANGMTSTNISVSETSSTPAGFSLQLTGTGSNYEDFSWSGPTAETFSDCNTGQTFSSSGDVPPTVSITAPADTETGIPVDTDITLTFSEDVVVTDPWFDITCNVSGNHPATESGGPQDFTLDPDTDFDARESCTVTLLKDQIADQDGTSDNMVSDYAFTFSTGRWVINEIHADPSPTNGDANGDGIVNITQDEFVEMVNNTGATVDISGWQLYDSTPLPKHTFPAGSLIPASCATVVFSGGTPTGTFGNAIVQTASNGQLDLNNSGDTVSLDNGAFNQATYTYGSEGNNDQSLTRDPDVTGSDPLIQHTAATGSGGALFSPGTKIDGTNFSDCFMPIHDIQGTGTTSTQVGNPVTLSGIVVGDFQNTTTELSGFYVQEEDSDADANPATSEGIFVYDNGFGNVNVGDLVKVTGTVAEFVSASSSLTEISSVTALTVVSSGNPLPTPAAITLPVTNLTDWERTEGMQVSFSQTLYVTEHFQLGRYGQVTLSSGDRLPQPTHAAAPGSPALAVQAANDLNRIILDDHATNENPDPILHPQPGGLSASNTLRGGDTTTGLAGVLDHRNGFYRVQPTGTVTFSHPNARTSTPTNPGGSLKVASFNVLNYFTTLNERGANTAQEFTRQRDKIISTLAALNADVVGLIEIENHATDAALDDLVDGLNAVVGTGTYAKITTTPFIIGGDQIKVALIYKPATVSPTGAPAILDNTFDPNFHDDYNRPSLAQTFTQIVTGETFTVVVNHFKSKGSACTGDPDTGDGQGNCNLTRTDAANVLVSWLATDPTASGDPDFLIIGDLNSYALEDPITALTSGGFTNLINSFLGTGAYSYAFDGQWGTLDYALANASLLAQTAGVTEWHINADEPVSLDYNTEFKTAGQITSLYEDDPYRASDHDPVIVGLYAFDFSDLPTSYGIAWHTGGGTLRLGSDWGDNSSDDGTTRNGTSWTAGNPASVNVTTNGAGYLAAWFDWNNDGTFDAGEKAIGQSILDAGTHLINITVGAAFNPAVNPTLQTRFRFYAVEPTLLSPSGNETPMGAGTGGEVEDYNWSFSPTAITLTTFSARSTGGAPLLILGLLLMIGFTIFIRRRPMK